MTSADQCEPIGRRSKSDLFGRYYTSAIVCRTLVNAVEGARPKTIIELGAGRGAITSVAAERWSRARLITVDTDDTVPESFTGSTRGHAHFIHDALDDSLAERLGVGLGSIDIGFCNPPFIRPRWRSSFGQILEDAGLSGALKSVRDAGADLLFIAQNLRLLKRKGKLGLILPDGLISASRFLGVRDALLRNHHIEQVIQLPRRVFSKTEAQTHLLVLSKQTGPTHIVRIREMQPNGQLCSPISVPFDQARIRMDFQYHRSMMQRGSCSEKLRFSEIIDKIFRGSLSSSQLKKTSLSVFHLGDFPTVDPIFGVPKVPKKFLLSGAALKELSARVKVAESGDILVARVGRSLEEKVCVLEEGHCAISDCVFVVRTAPKYRPLVVNYLTSESGKSAVAGLSHGVGARHISMSDFMKIEFPT